jgi:hypothetical protein
MRSIYEIGLGSGIGTLAVGRQQVKVTEQQVPSHRKMHTRVHQGEIEFMTSLPTRSIGHGQRSKGRNRG